MIANLELTWMVDLEYNEKSAIIFSVDATMDAQGGQSVDTPCANLRDYPAYLLHRQVE
jgi:hypothetical protein